MLSLPFQTLLGLSVFLIALVIALIIDGYAVKLSASVVLNKRISVGRGAAISVIAIIAFAFLFVIFSLLTPIVGMLFGLIGMVYVIKTMLNTGWINGFFVAIVAWIIIIVVYLLIALIFGGLTLLQAFPHPAHLP
ncbi:MAG: hypothetical protein QXV22_05445 [Thermoplasmataceae archaeon]